MKRYKLVLPIVACVYFVLFFATCTDKYNEYNRDISAATEEEMGRDDYLLRQYLLAMQSWVIPTDANANQFVECLLGGAFGGYLSDSNPGFNNRNFSTYIPENHWWRVAFNDIFTKIMANHKFLHNSSENPVSLGVADIIKIMGISRVTDIYGPIPYSQVGEDGQLNAPYDSQEQIYKLMLQELDGAIEALTAHQTEDFSPKSDRIYEGVVVNWIKLANSLKLRLSMRIADVEPQLAKEKAEEAANHNIGTISSNSENAFMTLANTNPFHVVMYEYNGGDSRISADITSFMNGYNDPRREKYFTLSTFTGNTTNGYIGLRSGIMIPEAGKAQSYSNMKVETGNKLLWMNAAEVSFLKAEGALRGWNMGGGSAEEYYNAGISLSFEQWDASGAEQYREDEVSVPESYKDPLGSYSYFGTTSKITVKYDVEAEYEKNLERIITQKWIANFPLGIEAWSEFRRTGYPKLIPVMENKSGGTVSTERMARRLPYPQEEYTNNAQNVANAVSQYLKGPDNIGTDIWWAKKN